MEATDDPSSTTTKRSIIPLMVVILGFTVGAAAMSAGLEYNTIMSNWDTRRCDIGVMMAARFFKPAGDERTPAQFSKDNFDFCMKQTQNTAIDKTLAPALGLFDIQGKAVQTLKDTQASAEKTLGNFANAVIAQILRDFYHRMEIFGDQIKRTFNGLSAGFKKIQAAAVSLVFIGLAMAQGILNFYNLVILVVIIILSMLAAVFILLIFILWPFLPTILAVIATLSAAGFGALVGGIGATFCFDGRTLVKMADKSIRKMRDLRIGDRLAGGGIVEGMHIMDGRRADMYTIIGAGGIPIYVSGDHLVWFKETRKWGYVRDMSGAASCTTRDFDVVYCPTISNRCLNIDGIWFRDWEEIPEWAEDKWEEIIENMLNGTPDNGRTVRHTGAANGVLGDMRVRVKDKGYIPIKTVVIGDEVEYTNVNSGGDRCSGGYTRVLGKTVTTDTVPAAADAAAGAWIWDHSMRKWLHPRIDTADPVREVVIHNLITEEGVFNIRTDAHTVHTIRDAFEVGLDGMEKTYKFTLWTLNSSDNSPPISEE